MTNQLPWTLRWRLSVLWMLEWGITGAILTYLPLYFTAAGINQHQLGLLMAVSAIGLWVAPFVVGQVCDRWMSTEKYLAVSHFIGGVTLICIPPATDLYDPVTGRNFGALLTLLGIYACAYLPTVPLASSLSFRHLPDPDAQFGKVRVWGTVGWVCSGILLSFWLSRGEVYDWLELRLANNQGFLIRLQDVRSAMGWLGPPASADCFRIAALLSFALSSFCVFLPPTPPKRARTTQLAPIRALAMFRSQKFATLIGVSFLLAMVVPFYSLAVPQLLERTGVASRWVPAVMTVGQVSEFPALLLLHFCLARLGLKRTFALGIFAWLVRYSMFALHLPLWLLLFGIGLHGVCHVFLVIVIQLYVDTQCPADTKASAQNLFAFITMGIAMPLGFVASGLLAEWCRLEHAELASFGLFFAVPALALLLILLAFQKWFPWELRTATSHGSPVDHRAPVDDVRQDAARVAGR